MAVRNDRECLISSVQLPCPLAMNHRTAARSGLLHRRIKPDIPSAHSPLLLAALQDARAYPLLPASRGQHVQRQWRAPDWQLSRHARQLRRWGRESNLSSPISNTPLNPPFRRHAGPPAATGFRHLERVSLTWLLCSAGVEPPRHGVYRGLQLRQLRDGGCPRCSQANGRPHDVPHPVKLNARDPSGRKY
jgi:hypothetical protein